MSLPDKDTLSSTLQTMMSGLPTPETADDAKKNFADGLAQVMLDTIKAGSISITAQTGTINVAGSATNQSNPAPITLSGGTIS